MAAEHLMYLIAFPTILLINQNTTIVPKNRNKKQKINMRINLNQLSKSVLKSETESKKLPLRLKNINKTIRIIT